MNDPLEDRLRSYGQVLDQAAEHDEDTAPVAFAGRRRPARRALVAMGTAAAVTVAALGIIGVVGGGDDGRQVRASGSGRVPLQRGAGGSFPLLTIEGWRVIRADDQDRPLDSRDPNGPRYHSAEATFTRRDSQVTLHMYAGGSSLHDDYVDDRAHSGRQRQRTVLGYPATVTDYKGSNQMSAIWFADQVVYELMLETGSGDDFFDALDALRLVDPDTWEAALPDSAVAPRERAAEVDRMLADIPQPPGFDAGPLRRGSAAIDRYQLGAKVAGSVACAWIDRWTEARRAGDQTAEREAADAMGTSRNWRVLNEMNREGAYPDGVWRIADAMATDGRLRGGRRTVEEGAPGTLGCG